MTLPDNLKFRLAVRDDGAAIVRMLADDPLGAKRERFADPLPPCYYLAQERIEADPNNELIVAQHEGVVIGVLQDSPWHLALRLRHRGEPGSRSCLTYENQNKCHR